MNLGEWWGEITDGLPAQVQQATTIAILFAIAGLAICISILTASIQRHRQQPPPPWPPASDHDEERPAGGDRNHNIDRHGADQ